MPHPAPANPSLVLLVRHGATEWSVSGRYTGRTDLPLTDEGVAQAVAAGGLITSLLDGAEPLVFTSPLQRAARTAALALPHQPATVSADLMEFDYGVHEGRTTDEIRAADPHWDLFSTGCVGGERADDVVARCDAFATMLSREADDRAVVVFTHGHLGRLLTARLLRLPAMAAGSLWNDTATVGVINQHRGNLVLVGWNLRAE